MHRDCLIQRACPCPPHRVKIFAATEAAIDAAVRALQFSSCLVHGCLAPEFIDDFPRASLYPFRSAKLILSDDYLTYPPTREERRYLDE